MLSAVDCLESVVNTFAGYFGLISSLLIRTPAKIARNTAEIETVTPIIKPLLFDSFDCPSRSNDPVVEAVFPDATVSCSIAGDVGVKITESRLTEGEALAVFPEVTVSWSIVGDVKANVSDVTAPCSIDDDEESVVPDVTVSRFNDGDAKAVVPDVTVSRSIDGDVETVVPDDIVSRSIDGDIETVMFDARALVCNFEDVVSELEQPGIAPLKDQASTDWETSHSEQLSVSASVPLIIHSPSIKQ